GERDDVAGEENDGELGALLTRSSEQQPAVAAGRTVVLVLHVPQDRGLHVDPETVALAVPEGDQVEVEPPAVQVPVKVEARGRPVVVGEVPAAGGAQLPVLEYGDIP